MSKLLRRGLKLIATLVPVIILLAATPSASLAATYNSHLRRYPYLTDSLNTYITINWATDQTYSTGAVRWGAVGQESCTAHYTPATRTVLNVNGSAEYQWKALLNLLPGTRYCYRVYLGSGPSTEVDLLGADTSPKFWTQVAPGSTQAFSFVVFGDWGLVDANGNNPYAARLMALIASSGARFALTAGDNSYPSGNQANYGDLVQKGANLSAIFGPSFWRVPGSSIPIFAASGNHGLSIPDPIHPLFLNFPQDHAVATSGGRYVRDAYSGIDGITPSNYPSAWYAFDAGIARIYMLDVAWSEANFGTATGPYQADYDYHWTTSSPEYQWLKSDLAAHNSALKFAIWHYPLYSDDPNNGSDTYLQGSNRLEGLLKQYGVNLAFAGHSHTYQRFAASSIGLPNFVTGGGGATPTSLGTCTALDAYAITYTSTGRACGGATAPTSPDEFYHFLQVSVNGTHVNVKAVNSLGHSFDPVSYNFSGNSEGNAPSRPGNFNAAAAGGTQANLSWSASSDDTGVRGYDVYRDGNLIATTAPNTLIYSDVSLSPATTYSYTVDAFDGSGNHSSMSSSRSVKTATAATYVFTPVADSYTSASASGTNFGSDATLKTGSSPLTRSFLRFHIGDMGGVTKSATLMLYSSSSSGTGYQVRAATAANWEENVITSDNAPGTGSVIDTSPGFSGNSWVSSNVTPLINGSGSYDIVVTSSAAALAFSSRDAGGHLPQLVIQTEVLPGPKFVSDTLSRDYGLVAVGESSAAQAITVTNSGGSNLMLGTVTLTGTDSADFHLYSDGCSNTTLPPNGSCTVSAQFAPTQAGLKSASINFPDNAEGPHQIGLSGTGGAEGLLNGGFNDYSAVRPHIPTSWQSLGFSATDGKNIRIKAEGIASVRISNISPVKKTLTQVLAITGAPGDVLQLSAWARGRGIPSSNGVARIIVRLYNGPTPIQTQILNFAKGTYPFKQTTANFTAAGAYDRILVRLIYTKGGGIIWVDSVSLLKSP